MWVVGQALWSLEYVDYPERMRNAKRYFRKMQKDARSAPRKAARVLRGRVG
jgi:hypothetical protein